MPGNCVKCGHHNIYQDGPYVCFSHTNPILTEEQKALLAEAKSGSRPWIVGKYYVWDKSNWPWCAKTADEHAEDYMSWGYDVKCTICQKAGHNHTSIMDYKGPGYCTKREDDEDQWQPVTSYEEWRKENGL